MRPVSQGDHETRLIGAPANWDPVADGLCGTLSVFDWKDPETGHNHMISKWELEPEDLEKVQRGVPIFLSIIGQVHPVVCVYVGDVAPDLTTGAHGGAQQETADGK